MSSRERTSSGAAPLALATLVLLAALTTAARADAPALRVTNLGQSSAPVEVGQPPLDIAAAGSCAFPFTLANESACPAGTWPPLGRRWGSIEDVAGGDTLRLAFSSPVTTVKVGSTSNYTPGLRDPDGKPLSNYDVVPETSAVSTADPSVWLTTLPPLDARAISSDGYTFSVVAQDGSGYHDYPLGIRSPRYANEATYCSIAYYSTGWQQYLCLGKSAPPGLAQRVRVFGATFDGRILSLQVEVPSAGRLSIGIPTICGDRNGGVCRGRTWIRRHAARRGRLVIRRVLSLRLGADRKISIPVRFGEPGGRTSAGALTVRVRLITPSR
jgi:hypothetical protein